MSSKNISIYDRLNNEILENASIKIDCFNNIGILEKVTWEEYPLERKFEIVFEFRTLNNQIVKVKECVISKNSSNALLTEQFIFTEKNLIDYLNGKRLSDNFLLNAKIDCYQKRRTEILDVNKLNDIINNFGDSLDNFNRARDYIRLYVKTIHDTCISTPNDQNNTYLALIYKDTSGQYATMKTYNLINRKILQPKAQEPAFISELENFLYENDTLKQVTYNNLLQKIEEHKNNKRLFNLDNKNAWVYDIEVYPELFMVGFKKFDLKTFTELDEKVQFLSTDPNYLDKLCDFLKDTHILVGFNNFNYDDIVIGNLVSNYIKNKIDLVNFNGKNILQDLSKAIIEDRILSNYAHKKAYIEKYKNQGIDINFKTKIFSLDMKVGLPPELSLKEIECNLGEDIKESSVAFNTTEKLTSEQIQEVCKYNMHDVVMSCKTLIQPSRKEEFTGIMQLVQTFNLDENYVRRTKATITTEILKCLGKLQGLDEFNFKYTHYIDNIFTKELEDIITKKEIKELVKNGYISTLANYKTRNDIINDSTLDNDTKHKMLCKLAVLKNYFGYDNGKFTFGSILCSYDDLEKKWKIVRNVIKFFDEIRSDGYSFAKALYKLSIVPNDIDNAKIIIKLLRKENLIDSKLMIKLVSGYRNEVNENNCDNHIICLLKDSYHATKCKFLYELYNLYASHLSTKSINVIIDGNDAKIGFGGMHCAIPNIYYNNTMFSADAKSYFPSLMAVYNYFTRSSINGNKDFIAIKNKRLEMKRLGDPIQKVYKIAINSGYGVQKARTSMAYDPVQANNICINGQIGLIDLILRMATFTKTIQGNTDGVVLAFKTTTDGVGTLVEDDNFTYQKEKLLTMCKTWETSYGIELETDIFNKIKQPNVNNYIVSYNKRAKDGTIKIATKEKGLSFGNNDINFTKFDKNQQLKILRIFEKESFLYNKDPNKVIEEILEKGDIDITIFQILAKTSRAYQELQIKNEGKVSYITTKVNRIFPIKTEIINGEIQAIDNNRVCGQLLRLKLVDKFAFIEKQIESLDKIKDEIEELKLNLDTKLKITKLEKLQAKYNELKECIEKNKTKDKKLFYATSKVNNASDYSFIFNDKCKNMTKEQVLDLNIDFNFYVDMFKENQSKYQYTFITTYPQLNQYIKQINPKGLWYTKEFTGAIDTIKNITADYKLYIKKLEDSIKKVKDINFNEDSLLSLAIIKDIKTFNSISCMEDNTLGKYIENLKILKDEILKYLAINTDLLNANKYENIFKEFVKDCLAKLDDLIGILEKRLDIYVNFEKYEQKLLAKKIKALKLTTPKLADISISKDIFNKIVDLITENLSTKYTTTDVNIELNEITKTIIYNFIKSNEFTRNLALLFKVTNDSIIEIHKNNNELLETILLK